MKLKILVLLFYYNRPKIVRNALQSLLDSNYENLEIAIIDDGSELRIKNVADEMFQSTFLENAYKVYYLEDTKEAKIVRGGSMFGQKANDVMLDSDADITIMLCDDDVIYPEYFDNLSNFYIVHQDVQYAYCHVVYFDPLVESYVGKQCMGLENNHVTDINPCCAVDASQVSWRNICVKKYADLRFPYPQTLNLDAYLYNQFFRILGVCKYIGFIGQYKGVHAHQLYRTNGYDIID